MSDNPRGCFRPLMTAVIIVILLLLIEIFGYARKTYQVITDGEQYSELGVITEAVTEKTGEAIERWKEKSSSESTTAVLAL